VVKFCACGSFTTHDVYVFYWLNVKEQLDRRFREASSTRTLCSGIGTFRAGDWWQEPMKRRWYVDVETLAGCPPGLTAAARATLTNQLLNGQPNVLLLSAHLAPSSSVCWCLHQLGRPVIRCLWCRCLVFVVRSRVVIVLLSRCRCSVTFFCVVVVVILLSWLLS